MEFTQKLQELLKEIENQEQQIENYAKTLEESGSLDESMELYLENSRNQLKARKKELMEEFKPKKPTLKIELAEGEHSPIAKERSNTPTSFLLAANKYPFYSVHDIAAEKWSSINQDQKKPSSARGASPSTTKSNPRKFSFPEKPRKIQAKPLESEMLALQEERKKLEKEFQECREIMNVAQETWLLIKERLLEIKEMEIENKFNQFKHSVNSRRGDSSDLDDGLFDDKPPKPARVLVEDGFRVIVRII
jgi:hypothetical protein